MYKRQSRDVAQGTSVAAMAITAHEMGHAQQDQHNYGLMKLRSAMVPIVNFGTTIGWLFIFIGLALNLSNLAWLGVFAFSAGALFSIATDVYKRQFLYQEDSQIFLQQFRVTRRNQALRCSSEKKRGCVLTVSYTHLDVYKRQTFTFMFFLVSSIFPESSVVHFVSSSVIC